MSTLFQSNGLVEMWSITPSGSTDCSSKLFDTSVTGSRQHAQNDSMRTSLPSNGGMWLNAIASLAQPAKLWNRPSTYAFTCDGNAEKGGAFTRLQFCVSSSTTTTIPSCSSLYAPAIWRRVNPVASRTSRNVGPTPCSHQCSKTTLRTSLARSLNSNTGTFCGTSAPRDYRA